MVKGRIGKHVAKCPICGEPFNSSGYNDVCPDCQATANAKDKRHPRWRYDRH